METTTNIVTTPETPTEKSDGARFVLLPSMGRFAIPISGCAPTDPIVLKPMRTPIRRGQTLVEQVPENCPVPLAPADGQIAALGVARITARQTVPAILFEPDTTRIDPDAIPSANLEAIPEMLRKMAEMDLAAGAEHLRRLGVWADRWTTPNLHEQLRAAQDKPVDTVLCSVLDESPDLLLHQQLAIRYPVEIAAGVLALTKLTSAKQPRIVLAAFGDSGAWDALRRATEDTSIELVPLADHYPQAHPTLLIHELTGKHSRPLWSTVDCGVLSIDAAAAIAVGRAFLSDTPMLHVPVGVRDRRHEKSYWLNVPIGMPWSAVLAHLSIPESTVDLRAGNVLREVRLTADCVASGGEHCVIASQHERLPNPNPCIRCAWCVEGCPVQIQPAGLLEAAQRDDPLLGETYGLNACIECGICSYVCPSNLPILDGIRTLRTWNARHATTKR